MSLGKQFQDRSPSREGGGNDVERMDLLRLTFQALSMREMREDDRGMVLESTETSDRRSDDLPYGNGEGRKVNLELVSLDEIAWHDTEDDCWVAIYDYVYDFTEFLKKHPGGQDILLEYAGRDATFAFIGTGHSKAAQQMLDKYLIGELPFKERLFRKPDGIRII